MKKCFRFAQFVHYVKQNSNQLYILLNPTMFMKAITFLLLPPTTMTMLKLQGKKWHW